MPLVFFVFLKLFIQLESISLVVNTKYQYQRFTKKLRSCKFTKFNV